MDYQEFVKDVKALGFVEDEATAGAAVKAVLGIMASSLDEEDAGKITEALPEPLNLSKLRGQQVRAKPVDFNYCVAEIAQQFKLDEEQARELADTVLRTTRAALGSKKLGEVEDILPESWRAAIEHA